MNLHLAKEDVERGLDRWSVSFFVDGEFGSLAAGGDLARRGGPAIHARIALGKVAEEGAITQAAVRRAAFYQSVSKILLTREAGRLYALSVGLHLEEVCAAANGMVAANAARVNWESDGMTVCMSLDIDLSVSSGGGRRRR